MAESKLYLGTRRYSSWSLRGWLAVRLADLEVSAHVVPLAGGNTAAVKSISPSGFVPYLEHDGACIWDSLAILEYCAEIQPLLWPAGRVARAHARAITAEMHSGFRALRTTLPMNCGRDRPRRTINPETSADIARIESIWTTTRARFGESGTYMFGENFTGADIMFAPVVSRFRSYHIELSTAAMQYIDAIHRHPLIQTWYRLAAVEPDSWKLTGYEELE